MIWRKNKIVVKMINFIFDLLLRGIGTSLVLFLWYLYIISEEDPYHFLVLYTAIAFTLMELRFYWRDLRDLFGWIRSKTDKN